MGKYCKIFYVNIKTNSQIKKKVVVCLSGSQTIKIKRKNRGLSNMKPPFNVSFNPFKEQRFDLVPVLIQNEKNQTKGKTKFRLLHGPSARSGPTSPPPPLLLIQPRPKVEGGGRRTETETSPCWRNKVNFESKRRHFTLTQCWLLLSCVKDFQWVCVEVERHPSISTGKGRDWKSLEVTLISFPDSGSRTRQWVMGDDGWGWITDTGSWTPYSAPQRVLVSYSHGFPRNL